MGQMMRAGSCERRGSTLVFHDEDGLRHAVQASAIIAASDADAMGNATVVQLPGGRSLMVRACLEDVIQWMAGPVPVPPLASPAAPDPDMLRARLLVSNLRSLWLRTMAALMEEGVLPSRVFRDMRDSCVEAARAFANDGGAHHREVSARGVEGLTNLFDSLLPADGSWRDT